MPDKLTVDHSTLHFSPLSAEGPLPRFHLAPSDKVAIIQSVLVKQLENDMLTAIAFLPRWLLTRTKRAMWSYGFAPCLQRRARTANGSRRAGSRLGQLCYSVKRSV